MNDQQKVRHFLRLAGRLQFGLFLCGSVVGYAVGGTDTALSYMAGIVIGWFSHALLNFTVASIVRASLVKASKGFGKMQRGALFLGRLILLVVAFGLLFSWSGLQAISLFVGLMMAQVSILAAGTLTLKDAHSSEH